MKKLIIAGSRDLYIDYQTIHNIIIDLIKDGKLEIVSGGCSTGVDLNAKEMTKCFNNDYTYTEFPADWEAHGKAAGPIRNRQMAKYADKLLLIWDGESKGSKNMKEEMLKLNKPIYEIIVKKHNV